jgi:hypothetical protein
MGFDDNGDGKLDHPLLFYFYMVLIGLNVLDILTTSVALKSHAGSEGNPFMAPLLPYAPIIKIIYLISVLAIADYIEGKNKHYGVGLLIVLILITGSIVMNNLLILNR